MNDDITVDLERMIDRHGLTHVLTGLSLVCAEKAEHLRHNWQDSVSAKVWDKDADRIEKLAARVQSS